MTKKLTTPTATTVYSKMHATKGKRTETILENLLIHSGFKYFPLINAMCFTHYIFKNTVARLEDKESNDSN